MKALYLLSADILVVLHAAYVGFVLFGMVAIVLGIVFRWRWVRGFWFRFFHFLMIAVVVAEALGGIKCPLTTWEEDLRELGGETVEPGTFVGRLCNSLLFYRASVGEDAAHLSCAEYNALLDKAEADLQRRLTIGYCIFGAAVLGALILAPPRRPTRPRWLVRRFQRQALEGWHERLRLDRWCSHRGVGGWLARFLSRRRERGTIKDQQERR